MSGESLEEARWPAEAIADGEVYSLEVSRAMEMVRELTAPGAPAEMGWRPVEPHLKEPPELDRMTGTYTDVSRRAQQLNAKQQQCGFVAWIFYPSPIEPQPAR